MSGALTIGLSLLAQSTLLLSLGLVAAWLLRRRGPALRAFVLQVTLAGVVLGSLLSVCLAGRVHPLWQIRAAPTLPSPIRTGDSESGMGEGSEPASIASVSSLPVLPPSTSGQGKGPEVGAGPEGVPPRHSS